MAARLFSLTTFNLYNLNEPEKPLYQNTQPWTHGGI